MNSTDGRYLRIVVGLSLVCVGYSKGHPLVAILGFLPFGAGALDLCVLGPFLGAPFRGNVARRQEGS
ncbi:MAG: DUF2892 domain-containing protein [Methylotenera sp.]|nr:DUF2892 domain-containing protein [Oligoflexia bacterium]